MANSGRGLPRIVAAKTTARAEDALAVLSPRVNKYAGEVMLSMLRVFNDAAVLLYNVETGRLIGSMDSDTIAALQAFIGAADGAILRLGINGNPTGILFNFEVLLSQNFDGNPDGLAMRNSVQRLVSRFIKQNVHFILLDQTVGQITGVTFNDPDTAQTNFDAIVLAGQTITVDLTGKQAGHLPFE